MTGGGNKQTGTIGCTIRRRKSRTQVRRLSVSHADVPAFCTKIFSSFASVVLIVAAALVGTSVAEIFASIPAFASGHEGKFLHIAKEFTSPIGTTGFGFSTKAIDTGLTVGTSGSIVYISIAIIVASIADLFARSARIHRADHAFAIIGADVFPLVETAPFANSADFAKIAEAIVDLAVTIVIFAIADLGARFAIRTTLSGCGIADFSRFAGHRSFPDNAIVFVATTGLHRLVSRTASFAKSALTGRAGFGFTLSINAILVHFALLFFVAPDKTAISVTNTFVITTGFLIFVAGALLLSELALRFFGAAATGFPVFAGIPEAVGFAGLCSLDADLNVCRSATTDGAGFAFCAEKTDAVRTIGAFAMFVFTTLHTTTTLLTNPVSTIAIGSTGTLIVFGATTGRSSQRSALIVGETGHTLTDVIFDPDTTAGAVFASLKIHSEVAITASTACHD